MNTGELNAAGYTTNRTAFLSGKFQEAGLDVVMPVFTNYSSGGDGIIAKTGINTVNDLLGKKIGVPRFSEAQTLLVWFVNKSDLSDSDKQSIIDNLISVDNRLPANPLIQRQIDYRIICICLPGRRGSSGRLRGISLTTHASRLIIGKVVLIEVVTKQASSSNNGKNNKENYHPASRSKLHSLHGESYFLSSLSLVLGISKAALDLGEGIEDLPLYLAARD